MSFRFPAARNDVPAYPRHEFHWSDYWTKARRAARPSAIHDGAIFYFTKIVSKKIKI
jgi:hypothetical protein